MLRYRTWSEVATNGEPVTRMTFPTKKELVSFCECILPKDREACFLALLSIDGMDSKEQFAICKDAHGYLLVGPSRLYVGDILDEAYLSSGIPVRSSLACVLTVRGDDSDLVALFEQRMLYAKLETKDGTIDDADITLRRESWYPDRTTALVVRIPYSQSMRRNESAEWRIRLSVSGIGPLPWVGQWKKLYTGNDHNKPPSDVAFDRIRAYIKSKNLPPAPRDVDMFAVDLFNLRLHRHWKFIAWPGKIVSMCKHYCVIGDVLLGVNDTDIYFVGFV